MNKSFFELLEIVFLQDSKLPSKMAEKQLKPPNFGMKIHFFFLKKSQTLTPKKLLQKFRQKCFKQSAKDP